MRYCGGRIDHEIELTGLVVTSGATDAEEWIGQMSGVRPIET